MLLGGLGLATRRWHYALLCRLAEELGFGKPSENRRPLILFYACLVIVGIGCVVGSLFSA